MSALWSFLSDSPSLSATDCQLIPLPSLGVLSLAGPESAKFLQGQATTDFREVEKGRVLPGAICSLKGRVLFSFIASPKLTDIDLVIPNDQLTDALTHLKKYAIFSKTQLSDAREQRALLGIQGTQATAAVQALFTSIPEIGTTAHDEQGRWVARLAEHRFLVSLPAATIQDDWQLLHAKGQHSAESAWWLEEVTAGRATIFAESRDVFQPQELNYPAIEGVSYNKGCYTGQEIVARLYFRGKLKQRLYRASLNASEPIGEERGIYAGDTHVGDVVIFAQHNGRAELLAIIKNKAVTEALTLGISGHALTIQTLPYELPAEKEE